MSCSIGEGLGSWVLWGAGEGICDRHTQLHKKIHTAPLYIRCYP